MDKTGIGQAVAALSKALKIDAKITLAEANEQGYVTAEQFAATSGMSQSHATKYLRNGAATGILDVVRVHGQGKAHAYRVRR